ncbi:hypothetical protein EYZ11_003134 [Aspergillus tanneri]|uniref:Uncharacterized protein n=1 Tax=Aspergillus tanneri TaxID=1220188 RepID=A0A4S3JTS5_9EURO|nr:hypothetical protein EYZ11_003134 [Aspergillus tanneri]
MRIKMLHQIPECEGVGNLMLPQPDQPRRQYLNGGQGHDGLRRAVGDLPFERLPS